MTMEHRPPEQPHPALSRLSGPPPASGELIVRRPTDEEAVLHMASVDSSVGSVYRLDDVAQFNRARALTTPRNRSVVVRRSPDGRERIIGGQLRLDSELSLPGGGRVPVGALTAVGVEPGAQGGGAFRALVRDHLSDCRGRGDAASVLMASQMRLYPRFGYGCAAESAAWEIDAAAADLVPGAPAAGSVYVEHARGQSLHDELDRIWRAAGGTRAGTLARSIPWWNMVMGPEDSWMGGGKVVVALHENGRGYLLYTSDIGAGRQGLAEADIELRELVGADVGTELDLWRFATGLPWARRIVWRDGPIDPAPLFWLRDARQLRRMSQHDMLWLRPLDLQRLADARSFASDGAVVLEVSDPLFDDIAGRFELRVEAGAGSWVATGREPSLVLGVADLGALWLGGASAAQLLAVRRIAGSPDAAGLLDAMLATAGPPRSVARF